MDEFHVPTVRVVAPISDGNPHGYIVINEADLSPDHEIHDAAPKQREKLTARPKP